MMTTDRLRLRLAALRHDGTRAVGHHWATRWVHGAAAALLAFAAIENGDVTGALTNPDAMRFEVAVGLAVTVAYGALWLIARGPGGGSRMPADATRWERWLAALVHQGIYLAIAGVLLTGFGMGWLASGDVVVNAAGTRVVDLTSRFSLIRDTHEVMAGLLGWLFAAHLAGALWHRLVRGDGVLGSISPFRRAA